MLQELMNSIVDMNTLKEVPFKKQRADVILMPAVNTVSGFICRQKK